MNHTAKLISSVSTECTPRTAASKAKAASANTPTDSLVALRSEFVERVDGMTQRGWLPDQ